MRKFEEFYGRFKSHPLWLAMERTVENSPWHREANVAVHTNMLLDWYKKNFLSIRNDRQQMLSQISCLFHDVGKPPAEIVKHSEERGTYRAYHGHEQLSARLWVDYAYSNPEEIEFLDLSLADVSTIALMIEYHVPFALKDAVKRRALKTALVLRAGEDGHQAWLDFLLCDQNGRTSDDQPTKLAAVAVWMNEWNAL